MKKVYYIIYIIYTLIIPVYIVFILSYLYTISMRYIMYIRHLNLHIYTYTYTYMNTPYNVIPPYIPNYIILHLFYYIIPFIIPYIYTIQDEILRTEMALKAEIRKKGFDTINRSLSGLREVPVELYKDYSAQQALTHAVSGARSIYSCCMC